MNAAFRTVLESAPMPPTAWNIAVACLLANAMRRPGFFNPRAHAVPRHLLFAVYGVAPICSEDLNTPELPPGVCSECGESPCECA